MTKHLAKFKPFSKIFSVFETFKSTVLEHKVVGTTGDRGRFSHSIKTIQCHVFLEQLHVKKYYLDKRNYHQSRTHLSQKPHPENDSNFGR